MASKVTSTTSSKIGKPIYSVITRLTIWYALVTLGILVVIGASLQSTLRTTLIRNEDSDQLGFVHFMQDRSSHARGPEDIVNPRMIQRLQHAGDARNSSEQLQSKLWPRVLDLNGNPISPMLPGLPYVQSGFTQALNGKITTSDITVDNQPVRVVSAPIYQNGQLVAVYQNARPLLGEARAEDLKTVMSAMQHFVWIAVIVSALTALILTGRAILPLRQITRSASQISTSNLSERLTVGGHDEFADLASTFNGMLDRVEEGFRRLEESYEQQRRFTGDASHELRTPLTIIKANASLALSGSRTPEEYVKVLTTIDAAADRTNRLIQDLLLLARADAGQIEIAKRQMAVAELVETAYSHVELLESANAPSILVEPIDPALNVAANADMIVRILDNLISNAIRHTPAGGEIRISAAKDTASDNMVRLSVKDTGEGIAAEHLPFLTERFYRADPSRVRKHGGTGLGLAICKSIVELHGGRIQVQSELGKGTTVTVWLPRESAKTTEQVTVLSANELDTKKPEIGEQVKRYDSPSPSLSVGK